MKEKHNIITCLLFITLLLSNTSVIAQKKTSNAINVLPPEINSAIYFGMNFADFKNVIGSDLVLEVRLLIMVLDLCIRKKLKYLKYQS